MDIDRVVFFSEIGTYISQVVRQAFDSPSQVVKEDEQIAHISVESQMVTRRIPFLSHTLTDQIETLFHSLSQAKHPESCARESLQKYNLKKKKKKEKKRFTKCKIDI